MIPFSFLKSSEAVYDPAVLSLTGWWRASYSGSPWAGTASAGGSDLIELAEATDPPATGAAVNGYTPADFDGTNDLLTANAASNALFGGSGSFVCLLYADAAVTDGGAGTFYQYGTLFSDPTNAEACFGLSNSGFIASVLDSTVNYIEASTACATGGWHLAQCKFDGSNLKVRVDSGSWSSVGFSTFTPITPSNHQAGKSYGGSYFNGRILEIMTADSALADGDFDNIKSYVNSRYALSL